MCLLMISYQGFSANTSLFKEEDWLENKVSNNKNKNWPFVV